MYLTIQKLFFDIGGYEITGTVPGLDKTVGETLLEPAFIYNKQIQKLLNAGIQINGMAHISGGGLLENIPRILPNNCTVEIKKGSWPILPVFSVMQEIGNIDESEMYRTFNMGIGLTIIVPNKEKEKIKDLITAYEIGKVIEGNNHKPEVVLK